MNIMKLHADDPRLGTGCYMVTLLPLRGDQVKEYTCEEYIVAKHLFVQGCDATLYRAAYIMHVGRGEAVLADYWGVSSGFCGVGHS